MKGEGNVPPVNGGGEHQKVFSLEGQRVAIMLKDVIEMSRSEGCHRDVRSTAAQKREPRFLCMFSLHRSGTVPPQVTPMILKMEKHHPSGTHTFFHWLVLISYSKHPKL